MNRGSFGNAEQLSENWDERAPKFAPHPLIFFSETEEMRGAAPPPCETFWHLE
jgi:hypothetical protein